MKGTAKVGHVFYGIAIVAYGIQQLVYADFRSVQVPAWQSHIPLLSVWAYITGIGLIAAGAAVIFGKRAREVFLALGGIFLFLFLFVQIPFEIFGEVNSSLHFGLWTDDLKGLALAGGAFVMAGSCPEDKATSLKKSALIQLLKKFIPLGSIFFSITMISFGIMHFMYEEFVSTLVPAWVPDHSFWTYFAAVTLIGSGMAIILKIRDGAIAMLLSVMIFLWLIMLHIPRAIADPLGSRGNEVSSVFDALAFTGIALVISLKNFKYDFNEIIENW
jgi:uncharacterized membrane protein